MKVQLLDNPYFSMRGCVNSDHKANGFGGESQVVETTTFGGGGGRILNCKHGVPPFQKWVSLGVIHFGGNIFCYRNCYSFK